MSGSNFTSIGESQSLPDRRGRQRGQAEFGPAGSQLQDRPGIPRGVQDHSTVCGMTMKELLDASFQCWLKEYGDDQLRSSWNVGRSEERIRTVLASHENRSGKGNSDRQLKLICGFNAVVGLAVLIKLFMT